MRSSALSLSRFRAPTGIAWPKRNSFADVVLFVKEIKTVERENLIAQVPKKEAALTGGLGALCKKIAPLFNLRGMDLYQGFTLRRRELKT